MRLQTRQNFSKRPKSDVNTKHNAQASACTAQCATADGQISIYPMPRMTGTVHGYAQSRLLSLSSDILDRIDRHGVTPPLNRIWHESNKRIWSVFHSCSGPVYRPSWPRLQYWSLQVDAEGKYVAEMRLDFDSSMLAPIDVDIEPVGLLWA